MDLIYINADISSVFASQVAALLITLSNNALFDRVILLCGVSDEKEKNKAIKATSGSSVETVFFKQYPNYPFFNFLQKRAIAKALQQINIKRDSVFHIRGEVLALKARVAIKRVHPLALQSVLVDVRGANREELVEFSGLSPLKLSLKLLNNKLAIKRLVEYGGVSAVSSNLKSYIAQISKRPADSVVVIPCLAGQQFQHAPELRALYRKKMELDENTPLLIFSSGGSAKWQKQDELAILAEKNWKLLNLSKKAIDHPNVINRFVPYEEVPAYLSAADVAIIFRGKSTVNEVASPVKFSEYTSIGLPVIADHNVGSIRDYLSSTGHGALVNDIHDVTEALISSLMQKDRTTISQVAQQHYSIQHISHKYLNEYQKLLMHEGIDRM
jgi:glycosyltransferase involved in cell wall biosynthesis